MRPGRGMGPRRLGHMAGPKANMARRDWIWVLLTTMWIPPAAAAGPPFSGDPYADEVGEKPEIRQWGVQAGDYSFVFVFEPGIPDPNQLSTITVEVEKSGRGFGRANRVEGANLTLMMKEPEGKAVGRYVLHALPLSKSKYATHFTPLRSGLYDLTVEGTTAGGKRLRASCKFPVDVWPLPKELMGQGAQGVATRVRAPLTK
jgi:hypothetical protein